MIIFLGNFEKILFLKCKKFIQNFSMKLRINMKNHIDIEKFLNGSSRPPYIGSYMQRIAFENNIKFPSEGRKMVIDSYFGENVGITCESLKHLLEMGLEVTKILAFIRYKPFPIFKPFVDKITRLRMQGDVDKDKAIIANIAKLLGNSAFGSCITDVEKHREVIMYVIDGNE